jgi:hypothetical protein
MNFRSKETLRNDHYYLGSRPTVDTALIPLCHTCFSKENQVQTYMHVRIKFHAYSDIKVNTEIVSRKKKEDYQSLWLTEVWLHRDATWPLQRLPNKLWPTRSGSVSKGIKSPSRSIPYHRKITHPTPWDYHFINIIWSQGKEWTVTSGVRLSIPWGVMFIKWVVKNKELCLWSLCKTNYMEAR